MKASDILEQFTQDGAEVELSIRGRNLSPEHQALVKTYKDELIDHLANERGLRLYGFVLHNMLRWINAHHELRLEHSAGLTLNATPEIALRLLNQSEWCVLYTPDRQLLMSVGVVPASCFEDNELRVVN